MCKSVSIFKAINIWNKLKTKTTSGQKYREMPYQHIHKSYFKAALKHSTNKYPLKYKQSSQNTG